MPAATLAGGHIPASLTAPGVGEITIPAEVARLLLAHTLDAQVGAWFRRLYYSPHGALIAMSSRRRYFPTGMAEFLNQRGLGICATPYCDAPARHADHIRPVVNDGETTVINGQALCEACNYAKETAGWIQQIVHLLDRRFAIQTATPTGHHYLAQAPAPPGWKEADLHGVPA